MRRMTRALLCVLTAAVLFALSVCPCFAQELEGTCGRALRWSLDADGTFAVAGEGAMTDYLLTDYHWSFYGAIRALRVGEGCTRVGDYAFGYCGALRALTLPSTVVSVGCGAFMNCTSLGTVSLPEGLAVCGPNCFQNCLSLRAFHAGGSLRAVPFAMFAGCARLERVYLPPTVRRVEAFAFLACGSLADVYFGGSREQWEAVAVETAGNETLLGARLHTDAAGPDPGGIALTAQAPARTALPGDVNGDGRVTGSDARLALRISARLDAIGNRNAADLDGDGRVTAAEAARILRMSAGLAR